MSSYSYSVFQDDMKVAAGWCSTERAARSEAHHYVMMYSKDGPVSWTIRHGRKTIEHGPKAEDIIKPLT